MAPASPMVSPRSAPRRLGPRATHVRPAGDQAAVRRGATNIRARLQQVLATLIHRPSGIVPTTPAHRLNPLRRSESRHGRLVILPIHLARAEYPHLAVSVLMALQPDSRPYRGGYSRGSYLPVDHALRSEPGADVQARRRRECRRGLSRPPEAGFALPAFPSLSAGAQRPRHTHHGMLSGADGSQAPPGLAGAPELPGLFAIADPRRTGHCGTERSCVRAFTPIGRAP